MQIKFISGSEELMNIFQREISSCHSFRMAAAWGSTAKGKGGHWEILKSNMDKLQEAILGIHFYQTEPEILFQLHKWRKLNIVYDAKGVFHPKFYLFDKGDTFSIISGSSNFTAGGFGKNIECNIFIRDDKKSSLYLEAEGFYSLCRQMSRIPDNLDLEQYKEDYNSKISSNVDLTTFIAAEERKQIFTRPGDGLPDYSWEGIFQFTWDEYVHGLKYLDRIKYKGGMFFQKNIEESFRRDVLFSIDCFQQILHEQKFLTLKEMPEEERKAFCGTIAISQKYGNCGWLGSMTGAGYFKNRVIEHPETLDEHLKKIPLEGKISDNTLLDYFTGILSLENVGQAGAVRLLAVKRPDLFVPINKANIESLIKLTKLKNLKYNPARKSDFIEAYLQLLDKIYRSPWYRHSEPTEGIESKIFAYRAALLDSFVYQF